MSTMKLLGKQIPYTEDFVEIDKLKFYKENPRVFSVLREVAEFENLSEFQQQEEIYKKLLKEPSVKNLVPDIKRHRGLIDPIVVLVNTWEVIEGNSRLAAYKKLDSLGIEGDWDLIHCRIISPLEDNQLAAFLNQIHVKGKTKWTRYEKFNFAYQRFQKNQSGGKPKGESYQEIAEIFGESQQTIRNRVKVIEFMERRRDNVRSHLSYYEVLVNNSAAFKLIKQGGLTRLLDEVKNTDFNDQDNEENKNFTAQKLRDALPNLLRKSDSILKQFENGKISFNEAASRAEISECKKKIERATGFLEDISQKELEGLTKNNLNAFVQALRKHKRSCDRISRMIKGIEKVG